LSSNAITTRVGDARFSGLESMLCSALLGKSPLLPALFANAAIDKMHKAVLNLIPTELTETFHSLFDLQSFK
jgi:hypothetical protein